jgi:hypothetical protein
MTNHPNKAYFLGVLTPIDRPSDKAPAGGQGHRVLITRAAAEAALPSLIGMGINCRDQWDGHDFRSKMGVIETAEISDVGRGEEIIVTGYLFKRDVPEVIRELRAEAADYGMSYEAADVHVEDLRAEVWRVTRLTFTGAAVLLRRKAACRGTEFVLVGEGAGAGAGGIS